MGVSPQYSFYLRSNHWRTLKCALVKRSHGKCEACGHGGKVWPIDGHHLTYRNPLESCTTDDLLALCRRCHDIVHDLAVPILFSFAVPNDVRRKRTIAEIRKYLPQLEPAPTPWRIRLPGPARSSGPIKIDKAFRQKKRFKELRRRRRELQAERAVKVWGSLGAIKL